MDLIALKAESEREDYTKAVLGFWVYIMSDCVLFGVLFAVYVVLQSATFGGPTSSELMNPTYALVETLILLTSSFTCGLIMLATQERRKAASLVWFGVTLCLGLLFIGMELTEFTQLVRGGNSWTRSAYLSSFFTLVGTHGLHVSSGLLWMVVLIAQVWKRGLIPESVRRIATFRLFWHFLDIVWIFIFTMVYLMGAL